MTDPDIHLNLALPATRKLYQADPNRRECEARVLLCDEDYVVLDRSVFYGESGGQAADHGMIGGIRVVDVQHRGGVALPLSGQHAAPQVNTVLFHTLAQPAPFRPGDCLAMEIDWSRRYALMRQHSACHFMYHAVQTVLSRAGFCEVATKGCSITPDRNRMDFAANIHADQVAEAEAEANALIALGLPIRMESQTVSDDVYYWRYGDDVVIPCGGTHVGSATELGPLRLKRSKKGAGLTRVEAVFVD